MVTRKGFVYDTVSRANPGSTSPELSEYSTVVNVGILENGTFSNSVTGLTPETTYYYRAYGYDDVNDIYIYGTEVSFTTTQIVRRFKLGKTVGNKILSYNAKIEKKDPRKANILKFGTTANTNYETEDEVKFYDLNENYIFGGFIQKITLNNGLQILEVADYYVKSVQIKINEVYENELIEDIIEDLITTYTDWTITSNITTGITINKIVFRDTWLSEGFTRILDLVNGGIEVDKNKNVTISLNESTSTGQLLVYGTDTLDGGWILDLERKADRVIVKGATIDQRTTETIPGTGTEFTTTYTPENVEIAGFQQTTSTIDGDYQVDLINKKIIFDTSQTDPTISYTYKSQVRVEIGDPLAKAVELEKKYLETRSEARRLSREYKAKFEDGGVSAKWIKTSSDIETFNVGQTIDVIDEQNNKTGQYTINKVTLELPKKMIVEVGISEQELYDQNKETIERIKQLERVNQNQDFITRDDFLKANLTVKLTKTITELKGIINDGAILWASETTLASDGDLISDDGPDENFALAYDDSAIPTSKIINYLE